MLRAVFVSQWAVDVHVSITNPTKQVMMCFMSIEYMLRVTRRRVNSYDSVMQRREFLKSTGAFAVMANTPWFTLQGFGNPAPQTRILVNDAHAGLNPTWVREVQKPTTSTLLQTCIRDAVAKNISISISDLCCIA